MAAGSATRSQHRGVFDVDEDHVVAALKLAWADGGYHGFCADGGTWSADQQRRRRADRGHAGRADQGDPRALAGDAVMTGDRAALSLVPDEQDQVPRLERFRAVHPEVVILLRGSLPRAWVGSRKIERPTLRGLLDELEEIFPPDVQASHPEAER
jgi:hypothetical protein